MITRTTKIQLAIFALITIVGLYYVGTTYAKLDKRFFGAGYSVTLDLPETGGLFTGADVSYRGVSVGRVGGMELTDDGVRATLDIDSEAPEIPSDLKAEVSNKSALGEQYVNLVPKTADGPYLESGSVIERSESTVPVSTEKLITDVNGLVTSLNPSDVRVVLNELGTAFNGRGHDIGNIIDASNSFLRTADANFATTASLLKSSATALQTQVDMGSSIQSFASNMALFSDSLVSSDADIRNVLDEAPATLQEIGSVLAENQARLNKLFDNLITTNQVVTARLPQLRGVLVLAPYIIEQGYTVVVKSPVDDHYVVSLAIQTGPGPGPCFKSSDFPLAAPPLEDPQAPSSASCEESPSDGNARGPQNIQGLPRESQTTAPVVGEYDPETGEFTPSSAATPGSDSTTTSASGWSGLMAPSTP